MAVPSQGPARARRRRSAVIAAVLSGIAPGLGHVYVARPVRGLVWVVVATAAWAAWALAVPVGWNAFRATMGLACVLTLALIVDAARLARRDPHPVLAPFRGWWAVLATLLLTGFAVPTALSALLADRAGLVRVPDDGMARAGVFALDLVIHDRRSHGAALPQPGDVVIVRGAGGPVLRRVVGLPGDRVEVRRGVVRRNGRDWTEDLLRSPGAGGMFSAEVVVGPDDVYVLPDRRDPCVEPCGTVPARDVTGRARWILAPSDLDVLRIGGSIE